MPGKIVGHPGVGGAESAGHIQHTLAAEQVNQAAEKADTHPAHEAGLEALLADETAADTHIELSIQHRLDDFPQIGGVMLSVAIHLDGDIVSVARRIQIPALHTAADAKVDRQIQKGIAAAFQQGSAAVGGTVVDDQKIHVGADRLQAFHRADDVFLLVVAGNQHQNFIVQRCTSHPGVHSPCKINVSSRRSSSARR